MFFFFWFCFFYINNLKSVLQDFDIELLPLSIIHLNRKHIFLLRKGWRDGEVPEVCTPLQRLAAVRSIRQELFRNPVSMKKIHSKNPANPLLDSSLMGTTKISRTAINTFHAETSRPTPLRPEVERMNQSITCMLMNINVRLMFKEYVLVLWLFITQ